MDQYIEQAVLKTRGFIDQINAIEVPESDHTVTEEDLKDLGTIAVRQEKNGALDELKSNLEALRERALALISLFESGADDDETAVFDPGI